MALSLNQCKHCSNSIDQKNFVELRGFAYQPETDSNRFQHCHYFCDEKCVLIYIIEKEDENG